LTFFDDFNKQEFDQDEDLEEQKIEYLSNIQREKVTEYLESSEDSKFINERHLAGRNTFYLKGLARNTAPDIGTINEMLNTICQETEIARSPSGVCKKDDKKSIVAYDYRKLSLYYAKARNKFLARQNDIYMGGERPHFKTTEALTRRLSIKVSLFEGAKILTPVDDFYQAIIKELNDYISNPETVNLIGEPDRVKQVISRLKTVITERIRGLAHFRFFSKANLDTWAELYNASGVGTDAYRRGGIIEAEEKIAPNETEFLLQKSRYHAIDELESIIEESIKQVDRELLQSKQ
jgi:hypothetical protein